MVSTQVKVSIAEAPENVELVLPSAVIDELGIHAGEQMTVEVVAGTLVIRRGSVVERTYGVLAAWGKNPPLTIEEEKEAIARAIAEESVGYE